MAAMRREIQVLKKAGFDDKLIYALFKDPAKVQPTIEALKNLLKIVDEDR